ncbi:MAG: hypothetical protein Q9183_003213 [Haloplaca sp. 2 TL-2023]
MSIRSVESYHAGSGTESMAAPIEILDPESPPMPIALLHPCPDHEETVAYMQQLYSHKLYMAPCHQQFISICNPCFFGEIGCTSSQSETEPEVREPELDTEIPCAQIVMDFDNLQDGGIPLGWTIGRGSSKVQDPGRGVGVCIGGAGRLGYKISSVQVSLYFHPQSGALMIAGGSLTHPLVYRADGKDVFLYKGDTHVLTSTINRLRFGPLEFTLEIPQYAGKLLEQYIIARNKAFKDLAGLDPPDPRLFSLPHKDPLPMFGPMMIHGAIGEGSYGMVKAGVHQKTGEPVAGKVLNIGDRQSLMDILPEVEASLMFPGQQGLMQALQVQCELGCCYVDAKKLRTEGRSALWFCKHRRTTICLLYPLAIKDLHGYKWEDADIHFIMRSAHGFLQGLKSLHGAGWIHGDLSSKNILFTLLNPPTTVLTDYGQAYRTAQDYRRTIGVERFRAPEVDGEQGYTNKIDVWAAGLILCLMLLGEDIFRHLTEMEHGRGAAFKAALDSRLDEVAERGPMEMWMADLTKTMVSINPDDRPSIRQVCAIYPDSNDQGSKPDETKDAEGPLAKIRKSIKDSDVKGEVKEGNKGNGEGNAGDSEATKVPRTASNEPSTWNLGTSQSQKELARKMT